jgi:hypothetical protein
VALVSGVVAWPTAAADARFAVPTGASGDGVTKASAAAIGMAARSKATLTFILIYLEIVWLGVDDVG